MSTLGGWISGGDLPCYPCYPRRRNKHPASPRYNYGRSTMESSCCGCSDRVSWCQANWHSIQTNESTSCTRVNYPGTPRELSLNAKYSTQSSKFIFTQIIKTSGPALLYHLIMSTLYCQRPSRTFATCFYYPFHVSIFILWESRLVKTVACQARKRESFDEDDLYIARPGRFWFTGRERTWSVPVAIAHFLIGAIRLRSSTKLCITLNHAIEIDGTLGRAFNHKTPTGYARSSAPEAATT